MIPHVRRAHPSVRPALVALDVDHTTITTAHTLSAATIAAVQRVTQSGTRVLLASSRPPRAMRDYLVDLGLTRPHPFVASQGAVIGTYSDDFALAIHEETPMDAAAALTAARTAVDAGLSVGWYTGEDWFTPHLDAGMRREADVVGFDPDVHGLDGLPAPDKLLLIDLAGEPGRLDSIAAALPGALVGQRSNAAYLEITRRGVDKASAIARLAARWGVPRERIVAIGDGLNDLGMLRLAGIAVAPANADPEVMAAADYRTESNDDDGVAIALDSLLP